MDYITSKVFVIAVGIIVTLSIVTAAILGFSRLGDIYNVVENTDISIRNQYDNMYSMYAGAELNTVGLLNTLRKYEEDDTVKIQVQGTNTNITNSDSKSAMISNIDTQIEAGFVLYETLYDVSVVEESNYVLLTFTKK